MSRVKTVRPLATLWVVFLLLFPALLSAEPANTKDIPRFTKVADLLYRGGQPVKGGFEFLKKQGVKTIINLREENDEESTVRDLGLNYIHLPMTVKPFSDSTIPEAAIQKYFEILSNPENLPVFIHCKRGADRTGTMVGFFRIVVEGWVSKRAYDEARKIGMRWWYPGLKQQLYDFKSSFKFAGKLPALATSN
jgi:tyrosine-protein phosphatase SIW14